MDIKISLSISGFINRYLFNELVPTDAYYVPGNPRGSGNTVLRTTSRALWTWQHRLHGGCTEIVAECGIMGTALRAMEQWKRVNGSTKQSADLDWASEGRLDVGWMVEEHLRTGQCSGQLCTLAMAGRSLLRMRLGKKPAGSELMAPEERRVWKLEN